MSKMIAVDGGEVYINPERTEVITTYGEVISLEDKEIVSAKIDHKTVVVGWIISKATTAVALVVESNNDPDKGYVVAVFPDQITSFGDKGVN